MTTPAPSSLFRRNAPGREDSTEYVPADPAKYEGLSGTLVPTARVGNDTSGFRKDTQPKEPEPFFIVKDMGRGLGMVTQAVSPRAMQILTHANKNGGRMTFEEAIEAEKREKQDAMEKVNAPTEPIDAPVVPSPAGSTVIPAHSLTAPEEEPTKPNRRQKRAEQPEPRMVQSAPVKAKKKIPVKFYNEAAGTMTIQATDAFLGGPGDICLVIVQDSPEGEFFIPPQSDQLVSISLNGTVYKCVTGTYYQIPGTNQLHVIYFIHRDDDNA